MHVFALFLQFLLLCRSPSIRSFHCLDHSQVVSVGCEANFGLSQTRGVIGLCSHWKELCVLYVPPRSPQCGPKQSILTEVSAAFIRRAVKLIDC
jgi:hypothetical protein